jgi:uncharacterized protein YfaS (alpha-2-macroglobulin family)
MLKRSLPALLCMLLAFVVVTLACSVPFIGGSTPTPPATLTPTPPPPTPQPTARGDLPPILVETNPPQGAEVPLTGPIVFAFNQPMDKSSVEAAFRSATGLSGRFDWLDDSTLWFYPDKTLQPGTDLDFTIDSSAQASNGKGLQAPVSVHFTTVGYLRLAQALPEPGSKEANPASAVVASFNRPVVALGSDAQDLPAAFRLEPAAEGRGEWLNTSTYIFYPDQALQGGQAYQVILDDNLQGADGAPLDGVGVSASGPSSQQPAFTEWTFNTALPKIIGVEPSTEVRLGLDAPLTIHFNQPMDPASTEAGLSLQGPGGQVSGEFGWDQDFSTLTFTPTQLLNRDAQYELRLAGSVQSAGSTPLGSNSLQTTFTTVPPFRIVSTLPQEGGVLAPMAGVQLNFSTPLPDGDHLRSIQLDPAVTNQYAYWDPSTQALFVVGDYKPGINYTLTVSSDLKDQWGDPLPEPYTLQFSVSDYAADLQISSGYATDTLFLTTQDAGLLAQALNISSATTRVGSLPLEDYMQLHRAGIYDALRAYSPPKLSTQQATFDLPRNTTQQVNLPLNSSGSPLAPGLYYVDISSQVNYPPGPFLIVVSDVHLTYKASATEALVWAIHLNDDTPVAGSPVTIYDEQGQPVASGQTDENGIFHADVPLPVDTYAPRFVALGKPGDPDFSLGLSTWEQGFASWNLQVSADYSPPSTKTYFYTDRPIYRPGQTVNFRVVVRQAFNGRYNLPEITQLPVTISGPTQEIQDLTLPISEFGTAVGEFILPETAQPGYYAINTNEANGYGGISFEVAEYRKPEIDLQVSFDEKDVLESQSLQANADASYFFGPAASDVPLEWHLYRSEDYFDLPGYQVGPHEPYWIEPHFNFPGSLLGSEIQNGTGVTDASGQFSVALAPQLPPDDPQAAGQTWRYTFEVTVRDETGFPLSSRAEAMVHPAPVYIGVRPVSWNVRAGDPAKFEVQSADWAGEPAPGQTLTARFNKVVWTQSGESTPMFIPAYDKQLTLIAEQTSQTDAQGQADLTFTPPEPGNYQLTVQSGDASTDVYLWVSGPGNASWPDLANDLLELSADQENYAPGDTAHIFIPNPLNEPAQALFTVERGTILSYHTLTLPAEGSTIDLPLSAVDAPNVYLTTTLLGQTGFRYGLLELAVEPVEQTLNVTLVSQPERTGPGDPVSFTVQISDYQGAPVQGEFSLSVVDKSVLALADPNSQPILDAFYAEQPLGVRTGLSLAAYPGRQLNDIGGLGGGGGGEQRTVAVPRSNFQDTAYWSGSVVTDASGQARVEITLPDNLTTWEVQVRALDEQTQVGQAQIDLLTTKDLLVRPVTPRFLVLGDHVQLSAVVQNNTNQALDGSASLQAQGFTLDDPGSASQAVSLEPGGRQQVSWWGTVGDVDQVDLVFAAQAGGLEDMTRPPGGALPVLHYTAPQVYGTSGVMDQGGERLEVVSMPRSFEPQGGELRLELSPSLAAAMIDALQVLEVVPYQCVEPNLSRFLPNLEAYQALQSFGLDQPDLKARLERTLEQGITDLLATQNSDGGWSWCPGNGTSDPYITTYVLYGLTRLRDAGDLASTAAIGRAADYLQAKLVFPGQSGETWQLDRLAFQLFALAQVDEQRRSNIQPIAGQLFDLRERLNPWSAAFLALSFEPGSDASQELLSGLQSTALRSDTGVHWQDQDPSQQNMSTPIYTTAVVIYALAQRDPASTLLPDAVRYVMSNRAASGGWQTTYESSWALLAMTEVMKGTGELSGDFGYSATVNDIRVAEGSAEGEARLSPVTASVPLDNLYLRTPNALVLERDPGTGRLYYNVHLDLQRLVEEVGEQSQGVSISRAYYPTGDACPQDDCQPVNGGTASSLMDVHLTVSLPHDAYYLVVEDYLPAGAEVLDSNLKTSQLGQFEVTEAPIDTQPQINPRRPYDDGWGWWLFNNPQVYDDHISWTVDYLPAGSYELTYKLVLNQPGEYRVLPAQSYEFYFPEVRGNSAGATFTIGQ